MIRTEEQARAFVAELCDGAAIDRIERYIAALRTENVLQNLVAKPTLDIVWQRHIADSAQLLIHVSRETGLWLDLGTGAGLPGLVIAMMWPEMPVILVESRKRRVDWLNRMVEELALSACRVEGQRLESVESVPVSVISARAFAPLPRLLDLSARFSTGSTTYLLPKGRSAAQELQALPKKLRAMFHVEQSLTDDEAGIIVGQLGARKGGNGR
jgi:16S rRNA (guanine527-N7)-methyltransferase